MDKNTQKYIILGPCALESKTQIEAVIKSVSKFDVQYIRAQLFKPRTNPDSFQGLGKEGLEILRELKENYPNIKLVCEVCSISQFDLIKNLASVIQIGARNMQNFELLKYISENFQNDYVLLKRGFANSLEEWIQSSRYLMSENLPQDKILLCERGSRSITSPTGVHLDFLIALDAKRLGYKVIIDPSHGTKKAEYVIPLAHAALAMEFDGLMIEVHPSPKESVSDADQALGIDEIENFLNHL